MLRKGEVAREACASRYHIQAMRKFILGVIAGVFAVPAFAYLYLRLGLFPVETSAAPFPFEKTSAAMGLSARIGKASADLPPIPATDADYSVGARVYRETCAVCHGLLNGDKTPTARGMYPPPPQLMHGKGVTNDPVGETHWKVANGIRLTGMSGYHGSLSDAQIWQVSELLADMNKVPSSVKEYLSTPAATR
jgi:thiosulfate dehydrogenase